MGSNYPCLKLIFMVPKVFEPLKLYFTEAYTSVCICEIWSDFYCIPEDEKYRRVASPEIVQIYLSV